MGLSKPVTGLHYDPSHKIPDRLQQRYSGILLAGSPAFPVLHPAKVETPLPEVALETESSLAAFVHPLWPLVSFVLNTTVHPPICPRQPIGIDGTNQLRQQQIP
jgi:hypothetical protein